MATRTSLGTVAAVLASMTSVQLGAAVSVPLFGIFGVAGTTSLRLAVAATVLLAVVRPWRSVCGAGHQDLLGAVVLGLATAAMTLSFAQAIHRIPLGMAVAVEFCGPLTVSALSTRSGTGSRARWLIWPALAATGVLALTRPWALAGPDAATTLAGLGFAALAATGWGAYILLTAHVGRNLAGNAGLSISITTAAVALAPFGVVQAGPAVGAAASGSVPELEALARCVLSALLVPLLAFALEMAALRRVGTGVFGVWMALEPAIGTAVGLVFLGQPVTWWQLAGVGLVTVAGAGANAAEPQHPGAGEGTRTLTPEGTGT